MRKTYKGWVDSKGKRAFPVDLLEKDGQMFHAITKEPLFEQEFYLDNDKPVSR